MRETDLQEREEGIGSIKRVGKFTVEDTKEVNFNWK